MAREASPTSRIRASLLAGAVGDALGAPIEFASLAEIRASFGPDGLRDYAPAYGRAAGAITDDTQMTLFVAEGLVLAARAGALRRPSERLRILHRAHLRWLHTQGLHSRHPSFGAAATEGWLVEARGIHARRAPGNTCTEALRASRMGRREHPLNTSKGCGGVMRVAPVGLARGVDDPFRLGCEVAALTHGHPTGWLAAGFLAELVRDLLAGADLREACADALEELRRWPGHEETVRAVERALALAEGGASPRPETVETLGGAWVAEEALAISLYCALVAPTLEEALLLAVNHGGDSDSTGSITGQIVGTIHGEEAIPVRWLERLELREEIEGVAEALATEVG
jgi:ADP-ribosyl-[dinitrogen reductase] hydrolase